MIKLNEILGIDVGHKVDKENLRNFETADAKEITVSDIERKIDEIKRDYRDFDANDFLRKAQKAFQIIFSAYAVGDKKSLKNLLTTRTYQAFSMAIDDRMKRGETLEGVIIRFISMEIIDAYTSDTTLFIIVKFITEQSNTLKSANGEILEGGSDFAEEHTDIWCFSHSKGADNPNWYLYEIKAD